MYSVETIGTSPVTGGMHETTAPRILLLLASVPCMIASLFSPGRSCTQMHPPSTGTHDQFDHLRDSESVGFDTTSLIKRNLHGGLAPVPFGSTGHLVARSDVTQLSTEKDPQILIRHPSRVGHWSKGSRPGCKVKWGCLTSPHSYMRYLRYCMYSTSRYSVHDSQIGISNTSPAKYKTLNRKYHPFNPSNWPFADSLRQTMRMKMTMTLTMAYVEPNAFITKARVDQPRLPSSLEYSCNNTSMILSC